MCMYEGRTMGIEKQKELTDGKGWKKVIVETHKGLMDKYKSKAKNIWGGVKVVTEKLKGKK
jgi:ribosomal protein S8